MSRSFGLTADVVSYLASVNPPEHPALAACRAATAALGGVSRMQISAEQGAFMQLLLRLMNAKRAVEVGVFTGYSALATALALQEQHGAEAHLLACDVSAEWTDLAKPHWTAAGVAGVIDLQIAPAMDTLNARIAAGEAGSYDFAFIDADKTSYPAYYEACLTLLRSGGLMAFDNVLWSGAVADATVTDADTQALRSIAVIARDDRRVRAAMVAVGDGLLLCRKE